FPPLKSLVRKHIERSKVPCGVPNEINQEAKDFYNSVNIHVNPPTNYLLNSLNKRIWDNEDNRRKIPYSGKFYDRDLCYWYCFAAFLLRIPSQQRRFYFHNFLSAIQYSVTWKESSV